MYYVLVITRGLSSRQICIPIVECKQQASICQPRYPPFVNVSVKCRQVKREGMNNPDVLPLLLSFHLCLPEGSSGFHYSKEGNANTLPPSDRAEKKAAICGDIFGYLSKVFPRSSNYFRKGRIYLLLLVLCLTKKCLLALPAFLQINLIHSPRCCVVEYCIKRLEERQNRGNKICLQINKNIIDVLAPHNIHKLHLA